MPDAQDPSNNTEKCKSCKEIFKDSDEFSLHVTLNNVCFGCNQHHDSPEYLVRHCLDTGHAYLCRGWWNVGMRGLFSTAQELQTHAIDSHCCSTCSCHHDSLYDLTEHCVDTSHNCICKGCNDEIQGARVRQHFPQNFACLSCHNHHQDFPAYAEHCDKTGHISQCFGCLTKFESVDRFREHLSSKYACLKCHIHFPDFELLRSHLVLTGHAPSCRSCRAVFGDEHQLNTHLERLLTCMQCHTHHNTNVDLMRHCRDTGHPVPIKTEPSGDFTHEDDELESDCSSSSEDSPQHLANHATFDDLIVNCCNCGKCRNVSVTFSKIWKLLLCDAHTETQKRASVQALFYLPAHLQIHLPSTTLESAVACSIMKKAKIYHGGRLLDLFRCPACDMNYATLSSVFRHLAREAKGNRGGYHAGVVQDIIKLLGWTLKAVS